MPASLVDEWETQFGREQGTKKPSFRNHKRRRSRLDVLHRSLSEKAIRSWRISVTMTAGRETVALPDGCGRLFVGRGTWRQLWA